MSPKVLFTVLADEFDREIRGEEPELTPRFWVSLVWWLFGCYLVTGKEK